MYPDWNARLDIEGHRKRVDTFYIIIFTEIINIKEQLFRLNMQNLIEFNLNKFQY